MSERMTDEDFDRLCPRQRTYADVCADPFGLALVEAKRARASEAALREELERTRGLRDVLVSIQREKRDKAEAERDALRTESAQLAERIYQYEAMKDRIGKACRVFGESIPEAVERVVAERDALRAKVARLAEIASGALARDVNGNLSGFKPARVRELVAALSEQTP